jgi:hypothetical protein
MRELEKENESIKEVTRSYTNDIYNTYTGYDSSYYDSGAYGTDSTPSTAASPSTVSAPAPQGAESSVSHETLANGAVPRTTTPETASEQHPATESPAPDSHSIHS